MMTAIVLLNTQRDKVNAVAERIADLDGVTEVYSVAGRYDLAAIVRARTTSSSRTSSRATSAGSTASRNRRH